MFSAISDFLVLKANKIPVELQRKSGLTSPWLWSCEDGRHSGNNVDMDIFVDMNGADMGGAIGMKMAVVGCWKDSRGDISANDFGRTFVAAVGDI